MAQDSATPRANWTQILLAAVGALLLVLIILLGISVFGGDDESPASASPEPTVSASASPEPSSSPSASPSPTETVETTTTTTTTTTTQAPSGPTFTSFSVSPSSINCSNSDTSFTITWSSSGAITAYVGVDTDNAKAAPYDTNLPPSGSYEFFFPCGSETSSHTYTVTLEDGEGRLAHRSTTMTGIVPPS